MKRQKIIKRNKRTAELVGLSLGDGGLTNGNTRNSMRFQLRGNLTEDREHYDNYIIPLFNKEVMIPLFKRKVGIVSNKNKGFYGLSVQSIKIEKNLNWIGIPSGVKRELFIPYWIKNNKKNSISFLRGLFDTDGTVCCQKNYSIKNPLLHTKIKIDITITSKNLIKEVSIILNRLRIKNLIKKPYKWKNKNWRVFHRVTIDGGINVINWFKIIGSKNPKHITKFDVWKRFGYCPPYTNLIERKEMLKKGVIPDFYYMRECRSGQTS